MSWLTLEVAARRNSAQPLSCVLGLPLHRSSLSLLHACLPQALSTLQSHLPPLDGSDTLGEGLLSCTATL